MSKTWSPLFGPSYAPQEMLELGIFEGKYINAIKGLPAAWYKLDKVVGPNDPPDVSLNYYKVKSRQPLSVWRANGWIGTDKWGWQEWHCHYYLGRRLGSEDDFQINRWRSFVARHQGQIVTSCQLKDDSCHTRQRQGLLQWAWDSSVKYDESTVSKNAARVARLVNAQLATESFAAKSLQNLPPW